MIEIVRDSREDDTAFEIQEIRMMKRLFDEVISKVRSVDSKNTKPPKLPLLYSLGLNRGSEEGVKFVMSALMKAMPRGKAEQIRQTILNQLHQEETENKS